MTRSRTFRNYRFEDWVTLAFFWAMAIIVFLQFLTRYVLNDSLAWTEEIARYLLMCVGLLGGSMAVRRYSHIHVEFLYVFHARLDGTGACAPGGRHPDRFLRLRDVALLAHHQDHAYPADGGHRLAMSIVYGICTLGLALMTFRSIQVAVANWRTGCSPLLKVREEGRHQ